MIPTDMRAIAVFRNPTARIIPGITSAMTVYAGMKLFRTVSIRSLTAVSAMSETALHSRDFRKLTAIIITLIIAAMQ